MIELAYSVNPYLQTLDREVIQKSAKQKPNVFFPILITTSVVTAATIDWKKKKAIKNEKNHTKHTKL